MARITLERLKKIERLVDEEIRQFFTAKGNSPFNHLVNWYASPQSYIFKVKSLLALARNVPIKEFLIFDLFVTRAWMITQAILFKQDPGKLEETLEETIGEIEMITDDTISFVDRFGLPVEETKDWFWNLIEKSIEFSDKMQWWRIRNPSNN